MIIKNKKLKVFIQARYSSRRLPGKVMFDINGEPLILHIYKKINKLFKKEDIVILTSIMEEDNIIEKLCQDNSIHYFRGNLINIADRYSQAISKNPCDYFFRISGDSPLFDINLFDLFISRLKKTIEFDIMTNIFNRTFPKGQSLELINSVSFNKNLKLIGINEENFTQFFYKKENNFNIISIENNENFSNIIHTIDVDEDYKRITKLYLKYKNIENMTFKEIILNEES